VTRSSLAATSFAAFVLATAVVAATPSVAATGTTPPVSFRNSRPLLPDAVYRSMLTSARALSCQPTLPPGVKLPPSFPPGKVKARKLSFTAAMASSRKAAGLKGSRGKKLKKNAFTKTAVGAERLAAAGIMSGGGKGALAALLVAADRRPRDPLLLIDAAALLIDAGKPNESLALLAKAQKLPQRRLALFGIPTLAVLETNRAAALFRTGQYTAAAAAGRRAVKLSPWLVEARENRGMALLCLGKVDEAACEFREAAKRPIEKDEERLTCVGARAARPSDFADNPAPFGVYPPIGYPALPDKAKGYVQYYQRLTDASNALHTKASDEYNRLTLKLNQRKPHQLATSRNRATDTYLEMLKVPLRAVFTSQLAQGHAIVDSQFALAKETDDRMLEFINACAGSVDPDCLRNKCNPMLKQNHTVFLARQTALETVMRKWWHGLHSEMLGYAQAIGDPDEHARAITQIDTQGLIGWDVIRGGIPAWNGTATTLDPVCLIPLTDPPINDATVGPDGTPLNPCPPALDKLKAKFEIDKAKVTSGPFAGASVGAGITVKCSEVSVSADASWSPVPLLSGFGKLQYGQTAQGGTLTIGIGSKGGIGPASFTSGLQLTLQQHSGGTNVDLAWKVGPSIGAKSDIIDITIFKSVAPPLTSPALPSG
jgi:tetratricopeptide (TPR) repeat protein